jgi:hypothetical protein
MIHSLVEHLQLSLVAKVAPKGSSKGVFKALKSLLIIINM